MTNRADRYARPSAHTSGDRAKLRATRRYPATRNVLPLSRVLKWIAVVALAVVITSHIL